VSPMNPVSIRSELVSALQLDLVGPQGSNGAAAEVLPQQPSRWYLTGFLVPFDAGAAQSSDPDVGDDIDGNGDGSGTDDDVVPERVAASKTRFPSSMGLSVLLPLQTKPSSSTNPTPGSALRAAKRCWLMCSSPSAGAVTSRCLALTDCG